MSFSKAPLLRFNDNLSNTPAPTRYTPNTNAKLKGLVPFSQKGSRTHQTISRSQSRSAERCCSQNSVNNNCISHKDSDMRPEPSATQESTKMHAKQTGSHASISYVSHVPPLSRKFTGSYNDMSSTSIMSQKHKSIPDKQVRRSLESQFITKKKKLGNLKKELAEKQKTVVEEYTSIIEIRDKIKEVSGKDVGPIEEIKLVDMASLQNQYAPKTKPSTPDKPNTQKRHAEGAGEALAVNSSGANAAALLESNLKIIGEVEKRIQEIPSHYMQLCESALIKESEFLDFIQSVKLSDEEETKFNELLGKHKQEGGDICKQLEETKSFQNQVVADIINEIKNLSALGEAIKPLDDQTLINRLELLSMENTELTAKLKSCIEELELERGKGSSLKDRKNSVENQLKLARQKLKDMEVKLTGEESRISQLVSHVKYTEGQIKVKETALEQKTKELLKANKSSVDQVLVLEKQRESLEMRVHDLKTSFKVKEDDDARIIEDLQNKLNEISEGYEKEHKAKLKAESDLEITRQRVLEVEEKGRQLAELAEKTKAIIVTGEESKHSEREVELWTELQSTRVLLKAAEGQVNVLKEEKSKFMGTITKATAQDDDNMKELCSKYGAEMIQKDDRIKCLEDQVKAVTESLANCEKQKAQVEKEFKDFQDKILTHDGRPSNKGQMQVQLAGLQQQVLDLQATLSDVVHQNEQLEQALTQKQIEVEQRDRVMREQSKVLKVRDELIGLLKGKEQRQDEQISTLQSTLDEREKNVDKVNKEIAAKAEEMQELYSTLESKQIQVMRLEKLVKQMEEQQERGQAQRTRHEARIAQLEHALQDKRYQRYCSIPSHKYNAINADMIWNEIQTYINGNVKRANLIDTASCFPCITAPDNFSKCSNSETHFNEKNNLQIETLQNKGQCQKQHKSEIKIQKGHSKIHNPLRRCNLRVRTKFKIERRKSSQNIHIINNADDYSIRLINHLLYNESKSSPQFLKQIENNLRISKTKKKLENFSKKSLSFPIISNNSRDLEFQALDDSCDDFFQFIDQEKSMRQQTDTKIACDSKSSTSIYATTFNTPFGTNSSYTTCLTNQFTQSDLHNNIHDNENTHYRFNINPNGPIPTLKTKAYYLSYPKKSNRRSTPSSAQIYRLVKINTSMRSDNKLEV